MTKEQELVTLGKIEKLIEGAGSGSYIAMAFEGCVADAKTNIENDWGCSNKLRADAEAARADEAEKKAKKLADELEAAAKREAEFGRYIDVLEAKKLTMQDAADIRDALSTLSFFLTEKVKDAEACILDNCDNPDGDDFKKAVNRRKFCKEKLDAADKLFDRIAELSD